MRKFKIILFATCLFFLLSCSSTLAATDVIASGDCGVNGNNVTWELTADGVLTISGSGEMASYSYSGMKQDENGNIISVNANTPWNEYALQIHSIIIGDGITSIGGFAGSINLTEVTIPNSVTKIERQSFIECYSLTKLILPDSVKSIGSDAFNECSSLKEITIPDGVTGIEQGTFANCTNLTEIILPNSITYIEDYAFLRCNNLIEIIIPCNVTNISKEVFTDNGLTNIHVDEKNKIFYSEDGVLFEKRNEEIILKSYPSGRQSKMYTIPAGVTIIGGSAFEDCKSLTNIIMPQSVRIIEDEAFLGCKGLIEITLSDNIEIIERSAFGFCTNLKEIKIPRNISNVADSSFAYCRSLTNIFVANENEKYQSIDGVLFENTCQGMILIQYPIGRLDKTYIVPDNVINMRAAFQGCKNLQEVILPDNLTSIESYSFNACTNLRKIFIPEQLVTIKSSAFDSCFNLKSVILSNNIKIIEDYVFANCSSLTDVYYTGTEEEWRTINIDRLGNDPLLNATIHYNYVPSDTIDPQNSAVAFESANMAVEENTPVDIHFNFDQSSATTTAYVWFTKADANVAVDLVTAEDAVINQTNNNGVFTIENAAAGNTYAFSFPSAGEYVVRAAFNDPMELLENGTVGTVNDAFAKVKNVLSRPANQGDVISVIHTMHPENWTMRVMADGKELSGSDTVKVKKNDKKGTDVTVQLLSEDGKVIKGHTLMITDDSVNIVTNKQTAITNNKGQVIFTITGTQVGNYKIFVTWGNGNTITIPVTVEKSSGGSSSGGSSGGGSSNNNSSNISNIVVTTPDSSIKITTSSVGNQIVKDAEVTVAENEHVQVIGGKNCAISISAKENGNPVTSFDDPVKVTIPVSSSAFNDVTDSSKLTLAKVTKDETGQTVFTYMGGNYDASSKTFTAYVDEPGDYILIEDSDIQKIELQIGSNNSTHNGSAVANDAAPIIYNNRTMVPLRFLAETLGAQVNWNETARTVTLLIDGVQMSMTIDEAIEGFDTAPIIYQERTMVPIRYIAEQLNANVIYAPDTQKIIVVK